MGRQQNRRSLRSKAVLFVSDLTTVFLNPISDEHSKSEQPTPEDENEPKQCQQESIAEERSADLADGPDTSSFTAFLYSLLSSESGAHSNVDRKNDVKEEMSEQASGSLVKEVSRKKSLYSRGKQSLGRAVHQAAKLGGYGTQALELKGTSDLTVNDRDGAKVVEDKKIAMQTLDESILSDNLPEISEPSLLLSEKTRYILYLALPVLAQGRKWVLLYSTWRHGISLATLYRRSMLCPGLCLLVVGDRKGAVFGGLIEAPLKPINKKYQGSNNSFVFTNTPGHPVIFRPTGINRYFTLCSSDFLALGGGGHFALYLDGDMLKGSSSASETYGNSCLAHTEDFEVKEIELWAFVYGSKYEEMVSMLRVEAPGICQLFA